VWAKSWNFQTAEKDLVHTKTPKPWVLFKDMPIRVTHNAAEEEDSRQWAGKTFGGSKKINKGGKTRINELGKKIGVDGSGTKQTDDAHN